MAGARGAVSIVAQLIVIAFFVLLGWIGASITADARHRHADQSAVGVR